MFGKIIGTGSYIPDKTITNDDIAQVVETDDTWIRERTGISERHILTDETTADMAVHAAERALASSGLKAEEIDLIIVSTVSSNLMLPSTACFVQEKLGAVNSTCFDVNSACTGFIVAYNTAQAYINSGLIKTALLVGAEGLSKLIDWSDRGSCILFGDGAGAVVIKADSDAKFATVMHADGVGGKSLHMSNMFADRKVDLDNPCKSTVEDSKKYYINMDGGAVFKFAISQVPKCINELLEKMNMDKEEIDRFVLHQANERIIRSIIKRLRIDGSKVAMNIDRYGNTSSACIPILLDEMYRDGQLERGEKVIMSGFGAGLTWAATYMEF